MTRNHWWDWLKIVAAWAMLCDHLRFVWPDLASLFWIGRIAFPVFGVIAAANFTGTRDRQKYILKLLIFGGISEIPFQLLTGSVGNILLLFAFTFAAVSPAIPFTAVKFQPVRTISILGNVWMVPFFGASLCVYGLAGAVPLAIWCFRRSEPVLALCGALMNPFPFSIISGIAATIPGWHFNRVPPGPSLFRNWLWWFYPVHLSALLVLKWHLVCL